MVNITPFWGIWEPVSSLMHLLAAGVVLIGAPSLVRSGVTRDRGIALLAFVVGAGILFLMSGTYHALPPGETREFVRRLDHAAIWLLIVGTFTPFIFVLFEGVLQRAILVVAWTVALVGVILKIFFFDSISEWVGLVFYIAFGWVGVGYMRNLTRAIGWIGPTLVLGGGVFYTLGAVMEFARIPVIVPDVVGPHELFHAAIVMGVICHWSCLLLLMRKIENRTANIAKYATPAQAVPSEV